MSQPVQSLATHTLHAGDAPLVISVPHAGIELPPALALRLTPAALAFPDTDWHVASLYDFAPALGVTMIVARHSRYLIDLNRPPDDAALYGAAAKTGLCPTHSFAGEPLYRDGSTELAPAEIEQRRAQYWQPYHDALATLLDATRRRYGYALLLDAHSIRSVVPRLFAGRLPDVNVGTYDGRSCAAAVTEAVRNCLAAAPGWSQVIDGRFKGGHITRHFGRPGERVHALQIELAQCAYMDEVGAGYDPERAAPLRALLRAIIEALLRMRLRSA
ncbi:MAG TPA: N-formylglutamate deformylase [Burkholderiaceae bacterium]|nr:N-formylglutamate deformylase [Burkholderiaceae bacterium]